MIYVYYRDYQNRINGGHIGIMLFKEMEKNKISQRPYWHYAIFRDGKRVKLIAGAIGIMLIIEIAKIKLTGDHFRTMLFIKITKNRSKRRPY